MHKFLITGFCLTILLVSTCFGQQYPVFTQYYFNELVINPAFAGAHVQASLTSTYRQQWVNFPGAPRTISLSGHTSLLGDKIGVGLLINQDKIGSYSNENIYGFYSYKIHFAESTLSFGLQAGFNLIGADFSDLDLRDVNDISFNSVVKDAKPNFGTGIYFNKENFFVGFSIPFILTNAVSASLEDAVQNIKEARYYFLRSGAVFPLDPREIVKLNPSMLVRAQEGQPLSMDLNLGFIIHDVVSVGGSWRTGDAAMAFIDLQLSEKFHFAYSYDLTSSEIRRYSNGSHEFMLNYRARISRIHKNLDCPTYYGYRKKSGKR
jgi:type IX secretion system PorP/SprF family membrane protein